MSDGVGGAAPGMETLVQEQRALNRSSRGERDAYAGHRGRVTTLLTNAARGGTLALLGAGNCNDVDLEALARIYDEIRLVDVDRESVEQARDRQPATTRARLRAVAPVDLGAHDTAAAQGRVRAIVKELGGPVDVVASACVLSQLVGAVARRMGPQHPGLLEEIQRARLHHLELLVAALAPGGRAVLVSDFVSSATLPELLTATTPDLPALVRRALAARNFFTGLNPFVVAKALATLPVTNVTPHPPWLWALGPDRRYLVFALGFVRSS